MPVTLPVFILAGGKSSRFGSDKARAPVQGVPLIHVLAERLRRVAAPLTVVADVPGKYADLGLETIADEIQGLGPLGGLQTALRSLDQSRKHSKWFLLLSCDLVGLDPAWVALLWAKRKAGVRAVAFKGGRWEPLIALYHRSIGADVERALAENERSMWKLLERAKACAVPLPKGWTSLAQVNTREQLADFLRAEQGFNGRREKSMAASKKKTAKNAGKIPGTFKDFIKKFPALGRAHEQVAKAVEAAGPLDAKSCALIKIGICVGGGLESATRSHVRRAMEHGATEAEIEQAILLAMNTVGFPKTVAAWSWARQQFERGV